MSNPIEPPREPQDPNGPGTPRWVKWLVLGLALAFGLMVLAMIAFGGDHGPGRH